MTHLKRITSLWIALLLLFLVLPQAYAAPEIDPEQRGSISIQISYAGEAVSGGSITLYHAATLGEDMQFVPVPEFSGCRVDLNGTLSAATARKLASYADAQSIPGVTVSLGQDGRASFPDLGPGLYLLVQEEAGKGFLNINPFVISIPTVIGDAVYYDVDASPKAAPEPLPTDPTDPTDPTKPTDPPNPPGLPQTGQLNWPVPVLALCGTILVIMGLFLCFGRRKKHEKP